MKAKGWTVLTVSVLVLALPMLVNADTMIKQVSERGAFEAMGQKNPATSDTSTIWMGDNKAAMNQGDTASVIMLYDKNIIYMIDHNHKSYAEVPIDALGDLEKMMGGGEDAKKKMEQMKPMMDMMKMKATVTPTEETMKIGDWNCKKYDVKMTMGMGGADIEIWATEDAKVDFEKVRKLTSSFQGVLPGYQDYMAEMQKIKGLAIKTVHKVNMMNVEIQSTNEIIEIKDMDAPAGTYTLPEGYEKTDMAMPGMGR